MYFKEEKKKKSAYLIVVLLAMVHDFQGVEKEIRNHKLVN